MLAGRRKYAVSSAELYAATAAVNLLRPTHCTGGLRQNMSQRSRYEHRDRSHHVKLRFPRSQQIQCDIGRDRTLIAQMIEHAAVPTE